jgi:GxxExxY protein
LRGAVSFAPSGGLFELRREIAMSELLLKDEVYAVIGAVIGAAIEAAIEVHRELGAGFLEAVYQESLEMELALRGIPFVPQQPLTIRYKGRPLKKEYFADVICYGQVIVELKALDHISGKEVSQLLNYLRATGLRVGLLINFGSHGKLEWKRLVL